MIIKTSGEASFAVLAENLTGDMIVRYGSGVRTSTPYFSETIKIKYDKSITCFGITLITDSVAIIDCVKSMGGATQRSLSNYYYITSKFGDHK